MEQLDLAQPAIVFWERRPGGQPGEITRFDRLRDAIHSVMQTPSATTATVAWISTMDRHIAMDEIRIVARRFSLMWRLSQVGQAASGTSDALKPLWAAGLLNARPLWAPRPLIPDAIGRERPICCDCCGNLFFGPPAASKPGGAPSASVPLIS